MPQHYGETERLGELATTPPAPTGEPTERAAMEQMPSRAAPTPEPGAPGEDEGAKQQKVSRLLIEMADAAQEMTQVDPRITTFVQDALQKLYLNIAKIYGVEDEAKLRMKKSQGQMQGQGMNTLGNL